MAGFALHAGVAAKANQRKKPERLCRYISRSAIAGKWLSLTPNGNVRYRLRTPYRDGTTDVVFDQGGLPWLDFMSGLAALVPKPCVNLTRSHGVFAQGGLGAPAFRQAICLPEPIEAGRIRVFGKVCGYKCPDSLIAMPVV